MKEKVVIIGAGGHGKVVADIVLANGDVVLGFLDDSQSAGTMVCGIPVLGPVERYEEFSNVRYVAAVGNAEIRRKLVSKLEGVVWHTAIHPSAVISPLGTAIGAGTVVMANAVVNPCAKIGDHCIINTGAIVEHDNEIGNFCHISVGAKLGGTVKVGANTWVGIGATVSNNVSVCDGCEIGAGAVVIRSINNPGTYVGVPARNVK